MLGKAALAAGFIAATVAFGPAGTSANVQRGGVAVHDRLVMEVKKGGSKSGKSHHHRRHRTGVYLEFGYCSAERSACAAKYGWRTRSYYRCLRRAGC
jgi:hypothetical protein